MRKHKAEKAESADYQISDFQRSTFSVRCVRVLETEQNRRAAPLLTQLQMSNDVVEKI